MTRTTIKLTKTADGWSPLDPGDIAVLHVDGKDVLAPSGWTENAAVGASGTFFWRVVQHGDPPEVTLFSTSTAPLTVDAMALWTRLLPGGEHV